MMKTIRVLTVCPECSHTTVDNTIEDGELVGAHCTGCSAWYSYEELQEIREGVYAKDV